MIDNAAHGNDSADYANDISGGLVVGNMQDGCKSRDWEKRKR